MKEEAKKEFYKRWTREEFLSDWTTKDYITDDFLFVREGYEIWAISLREEDMGKGVKI